jgi:hypothetical protein
MRGEVADQDVRQRFVGVAATSSRSKLSSPLHRSTGCAVLIDDVTALAFTTHGMRFRFRFLVLGSYKTTLDPQPRSDHRADATQTEYRKSGRLLDIFNSSINRFAFRRSGV